MEKGGRAEEGFLYIGKDSSNARTAMEMMIVMLLGAGVTMRVSVTFEDCRECAVPATTEWQDIVFLFSVLNRTRQFFFSLRWKAPF